MMLMSSMGRHSSGVASMPLRMKIAALFTSTWIAPKMRDGFRGHAGCARLVRHVRVHEKRLSTCSLDLVCGLTSARLVALGDHDGGAFFGKELRRRAADSRASTGDHGDFRLQSIHGCVLALWIPGPWPLNALLARKRSGRPFPGD